jgi:hypothetical protein
MKIRLQGEDCMVQRRAFVNAVTNRLHCLSASQWLLPSDARCSVRYSFCVHTYCHECTHTSPAVCTKTPNILSIIIPVFFLTLNKRVWVHMHWAQKKPDESEIPDHSSILGPQYVTLLEPRIWKQPPVICELGLQYTKTRWCKLSHVRVIYSLSCPN